MPKKEPAEERFWRKVKRLGLDDCWLWLGSKTSAGYGRFWTGFIYEQAHRFAYESFFGKVPRRLIMLHRCDNPSCVNPAHVFPGTQKRNIEDAIAKGRR